MHACASVRVNLTRTQFNVATYTAQFNEAEVMSGPGRGLTQA